MRRVLVRIVVFAALAIIGVSLVQAVVPDKICRLQQQTRIDPTTLAAANEGARTVYRFKNGQLFIGEPDAAEYLYGSVTEIEPGRFVSGHKTLLFTDATRLVAIHVHSSDIRASLFVCS